MDHDPVSIARRAITLLDLTELGDDATADDVTALCGRAVSPYGTVAAVCVWPRHVALAVSLLAGTGVRVATVVNFPSGTEPVDDVLAQTRGALADGADEIDLVLPYPAFIAGDTTTPAKMVDAVRAVVNGDHLLKVILETGVLADPELIAAASQLAIDHGADFIKTSTGKTATSAQIAATDVMLHVIHDAGRPVGLKPSGGIRQVDDARAFIDQADRIMGEGWATPSTFRFGASGLLTALIAAIEGNAGVTATEAY